MKLRLFVSGSAALFAAWLGLTFVREVPRENYPELGGEVATTSVVPIQLPEAAEIPEDLAAAAAAVVMD